jgi:hypothetical protein
MMGPLALRSQVGDAKTESVRTNLAELQIPARSPNNLHTSLARSDKFNQAYISLNSNKITTLKHLACFDYAVFKNYNITKLWFISQRDTKLWFRKKRGHKWSF